MRIDGQKLDLILARRCTALSDLRTEMAPQTLRRIREGQEVRTTTVGRLAKLLEVDPEELVREEA